MRKMLVYFMLGTMLLAVNQKAIAGNETDKTLGKVYHFIFKLETNISASKNQAIMNGFKTKMDALGIIKYSIQQDKDMFIVTTKTHLKPETIIAAIQDDKVAFPLTLVTYFGCDAAQNREQFFIEGS